jgi:hypothetical protein
MAKLADVELAKTHDDWLECGRVSGHGPPDQIEQRPWALRERPLLRIQPHQTFRRDRRERDCITLFGTRQPRHNLVAQPLPLAHQRLLTQTATFAPGTGSGSTSPS